MKTTKEQNLERAREAIFKAWGDRLAIMCAKYVPGQDLEPDFERAREIIRDATYTGDDDPGGWSRDAEVVIHCETGIPTGYYEPTDFEKWFEVSDELGDLYCEHVNAAVIAVYRN